MLVNTGEQILELLVIGSVIFIAAAILIIVLLIMKRKKNHEETLEHDDTDTSIIAPIESEPAAAEEATAEQSGSTSDFTISKETKVTGEDSEEV